MNNFFKELAETLVDRQELRMSIKKIGEDIVVVVTPDFKSGTKNIELSGTPDEMDENFLTEIKKPLEADKQFSSNAAEVTTEIEEEKETKEVKSKVTPKSTEKVAAKKVTPKVETPEEEKEEEEKIELEEVVENLETKTSDEIEAAIIEEVKIEEVKEEVKEKNQPTTKSFDELMAAGKQFFNDRLYQDAETSYKEALALKPDNEKAKAALKNATAWVKAVNNIKKPEETNA